MYIVFQFMEGTNRMMKQQWTFAEIEIRRWCLQVLPELSHACKFIHRDIKSENLLLDKVYKVMMDDFGLALDINCVDDMRSRGSYLVGTIYYMGSRNLLG